MKAIITGLCILALLGIAVTSHTPVAPQPVRHISAADIQHMGTESQLKELCDQAIQQRDELKYQECGLLQQQLGMEYLCNQQSCWVEQK